MAASMHARLHENVLATENPENRRAYSSAFSSKIWYSRVICVFLIVNSYLESAVMQEGFKP